MTDKITTSQAIPLLAARTGHRYLKRDRIEYALRQLVKAGLVDEPGEYAWELSPRDVDLVEGWLTQRAAPWSRMKLSRMSGGFRAWLMWPDGRKVLSWMPLSWAQVSPLVDSDGPGTEPRSVVMTEWPTGRRTGRLVRRMRADEAELWGFPVYDVILSAHDTAALMGDDTDDDEAG